MNAPEIQLTPAVLEAMGHLDAALIQQIPSDDKIIMGHIQAARDLLKSALAKAEPMAFLKLNMPVEA